MATLGNMTDSSKLHSLVGKSSAAKCTYCDASNA